MTSSEMALPPKGDPKEPYDPYAYVDMLESETVNPWIVPDFICRWSGWIYERWLRLRGSSITDLD